MTIDEIANSLDLAARIMTEPQWSIFRGQGGKKCYKCNGSGLWNNRPGYKCFTCDGKGISGKAETKIVFNEAGTLLEHMRKARQAGIPSPTMRIEGFKLTLAQKYANKIWLADSKGNLYGNLFFPDDAKPTLTLTQDIELIDRVCRDIWNALQNPLESATQYGRKIGHCAICGLTLTNAESIARGIGPICAGKFGL